MAEREDLGEVLSWITPEDSTDTDLLVIGSAYAASRVADRIPDFRKQAETMVWSTDSRARQMVQREVAARLLAEEGVRIRNEWLKEQGAYRG